MIGSAGNSPEHLIDNCIDTEISAVLCRQAGATRIGQRQAFDAKSLICKFAEVIPAAELYRAGETEGVLTLIVGKINFSHEQRWIVHAKAGAGGVAPLRITRPRSRWVSIENGGEDRQLIVGRNLHPHAWCRQRISGPPAGKICGSDGRPTERRIDEKTTVLAYKKLVSRRVLRRELTRSYGHDAVDELLFDPKVEEACRGQRLNPTYDEEIIEVIA